MINNSDEYDTRTQDHQPGAVEDLEEGEGRDGVQDEESMEGGGGQSSNMFDHNTQYNQLMII